MNECWCNDTIFEINKFNMKKRHIYSYLKDINLSECLLSHNIEKVI